MADSTPLLGTNGLPDTSDDALQQALEEGVVHGSGSEVDFGTLVDTCPERVLEYITKRGTKLLGTFRVEVRPSAQTASHGSCCQLFQMRTLQLVLFWFLLHSPFI